MKGLLSIWRARKSFWERVWEMFSSGFFAVVLLAVTAVVSVLGTVVPQKESPEVYYKLYGEVFYRFFGFLGLTSLFSSPFFLALLLLLGISLFACSLKRWTMAVQGKMDFYLWGAFLAHISVLIIYVGAIWGGAAGFSRDVSIEKGALYIEPDAGFRVRLNDFNAKFDERGKPLAFSSDLSVIDGGGEVLRKTISVNHPLFYKGIKFYQSSYGLTGVLEVKSTDGKLERLPIYKGGCAVYSGTGQMFHVQELFPDLHFVHGMPIDTYEPTRAIVQLVAHEGGLQGNTWLMQGKPVRWENYSLNLAEVKEYTGLTVKKDPGVPAVYLGFLFLSVGVGMMLYKVKSKN